MHSVFTGCIDWIWFPAKGWTCWYGDRVRYRSKYCSIFSLYKSNYWR